MNDNKPLHEQAYNDYEKGLKQREIAKKYNVSLNTIKSWQQRYWRKKGMHTNEEKYAHQNKEVCIPKKKKGAPSGNQNAKGNSGGAPEGSQNNYKHGIYEKLRFEMLSPEEQKLLMDIDNIDMEMELRKTIRECDINILKYHRAINEATAKPGGIFAQSGFKRTVNFHSKKDSEDNSDSKDNSVETIQTNTLTTHDLILRYGNEIHKWESKRIRCVETLIRYGFDIEKLELEKKKFEKDGSGDGNMGMLVSSIENARKKRGGKK